MPKMNMTLVLLCMIVTTFMFGQYVPLFVASGFLAFSYTLKEIIVFLLPVIIFSCVLSCMLSLKSRALSFLATVFVFVSLSNFSFTLVSYFIATFSFQLFELKMAGGGCGLTGLAPLWTLKLRNWIPNDIALYLGLATGALFTFNPQDWVDRISVQLKKAVDFFLQRLFLPVLPLFVFGFLLKLKIDGTLSTIVASYFPILGLLVSTFLGIISFLYLALARGQIKVFLAYIRNALPASLVGFSTMSSIAAMPVNLVGVAKNTQDSRIAAAAIPAVVNIHLIGDSLGIPILALAVIKTFGLPIPEMSVYVFFSFFFMLAKFATAAVPCGTIMIMIPVLEKYLGFTTEMSGLIMALYMLVDPLVTATSVLGNNAFAILMAKVFDENVALS